MPLRRKLAEHFQGPQLLTLLALLFTPLTEPVSLVGLWLAIIAVPGLWWAVRRHSRWSDRRAFLVNFSFTIPLAMVATCMLMYWLTFGISYWRGVQGGRSFVEEGREHILRRTNFGGYKLGRLIVDLGFVAYSAGMDGFYSQIPQGAGDEREARSRLSRIGAEFITRERYGYEEMFAIRLQGEFPEAELPWCTAIPDVQLLIVDSPSMTDSSAKYLRWVGCDGGQPSCLVLIRTSITDQGLTQLCDPTTLDMIVLLDNPQISMEQVESLSPQNPKYGTKRSDAPKIVLAESELDVSRILYDCGIPKGPWKLMRPE